MLFEFLPSRASAKLLAVSENLLVYSLYEEAFVTDGTHAHAVGAPVHGDPVCAAIARDESWCAVAGFGVEILLALPGQTLARGGAGEAFSLALGWVEALWVTGPREIGAVVAPDHRHAHRRLLTIDVDTRQVHAMAGAQD